MSKALMPVTETSPTMVKAATDFLRRIQDLTIADDQFINSPRLSLQGHPAVFQSTIFPEIASVGFSFVTPEMRSFKLILYAYIIYFKTYICILIFQGLLILFSTQTNNYLILDNFCSDHGILFFTFFPSSPT